MAIQNVFKTFNAQKTDGKWILAANSTGTIRADAAVSAPTGDDCDAAIAAILTAKRDASLGNVDDLNELLGVIG